MNSNPILRSVFLCAALWLTANPEAFSAAPVRPARVALVIGNNRYEAAVGALRNPVNDAKAMAKTLRTLGFSVTEKHNVSRDELAKAVLQFRTGIRQAEVALFYFAGHGISVAGSNYLLPIGSGYRPEGATGTDLRLLAETRLFNAEQAVVEMSQVGVGCNLVILDACRNTPAARDPKTRSATPGGLVEMSPPAGSLVAFATDSGHTANDGDRANGLYTEELIRHLLTPGLSIEQVFKRTRAGVMARTEGAQVPAEYSRLVGDDIVLLPRTVTAAAVEPRAEAIPMPADIAQLAASRDAPRCLAAVRTAVRAQGMDARLAAPLETLLTQVKESLRGPDTSESAAEGALRICDGVLDVAPTALPAERAETKLLLSHAHNRRGDALLLLRRAEEALGAYQAAAALAPEDGFILYNRGRAYAALGRTEEARADFTAAAGPKFKRSAVRSLAQKELAELK